VLSAVLPFTSVARTVKLNVPAEEEVPERSPEEDKVIPPGSEPEARV
jgi:hypothetical protein